MSVTPRTLHSVADVVVTSSGMKKNIMDEEKPQRHWTAVSSVKTTEDTDGNGTEGNRAINRIPDDGVLLVVTVFIRGRQLKALVDSGASRCFISPSVITGSQTSREEIRHIPRIGGMVNVCYHVVMSLKSL